jgi:hypothetical protein
MQAIRPADLLRQLRVIYGDRTPSVYVLRSALNEGRVEGRRDGKEWEIYSSVDEAAVGLRLKKPDQQIAA